MKKIFSLILLTGWFSNYFGQITTTVDPTIAQMQALLQGNGIVISGLTKTCPAGASAIFNNGAAALGGLNSGILLTTGTASNVSGPTPNTTSNNLSYNSSALGSPLGNSLSGGTTYDGCYITFLITPNCSTLSIKYVFASEEYPEYSEPDPIIGVFNDVFGFALSGPNPSGGNYNQQNIATVPGAAGTAVGIANVNNGNSNTGPCVNCTYYQGAPGGLEYDGRTTVLTASANVTPCQTYTMTIGIWDDNDGNFDSGVFLDVNGLSCVGNPTITAVANPSTICGAQTVTLTTGGGIASGTYTWAAPASGGLVSTNGQTVTANPATATTYSVLYSDVNTCPGVPLVTTTTVSFTPPPALPVSQSPPGAICSGQSVTLTANGGSGTYSWSPGIFLSTTSNSVTVSTPSVTTTYTVTKTVGSCVSSTVITVNVNSSSSISITPSLSTICSGQSVGLSASGAGPFAWTASSGANPAAAANVTVSPTTTTSYTVLSGIGSCTASAVATVSISLVPSISITPSLTSICSGQSAVLTSSGAGPHVWTASSGVNPPSAANVTVSPTSTTTYSVLSGSGTCTASAVATVVISPPSQVTITPNVSSICVGASATLTASGSGPFVWTASDASTLPTSASVVVSPLSATSYSVISGVGTCTSSATANVTISAPAPLSITPNFTTICNGQNTNLTASGAVTYTWLPGASSSNVVNVNPSVTTIYTVTGTSVNGCLAIPATSSVTVLPSINPTLTASSNSVCLTSSVSISASPSGVGFTYTWTPISAISGASNTSSIVAIPPTTASVIYTVNISNGVCASSNTLQMQVVTKPKGSFNFTNDTVCVNGCVSFTSTSTGSSPINHNWYFDNGVSTSTIGVTADACYPNAGTFSVTMLASNLCGTDTVRKNNLITVFEYPNLVAYSDTTINIGESGQVHATGGLSYYWSPNVNGSIECPTCASTNVSPIVTTQYIVVASNSIYCKVQDTVTVIVDVNCGDFFIPNVFSPNDDGLNDVINVHGRCVYTFNLQIFNRWGEKVFETSSLSESWDGTFRGQKLDTGVFVYKADGVSIDGKTFKLQGNITLLR